MADTKEVAEYLKRSPRTLEKWRQEGFGPPYIPGGKVRYRWSDIDEWLDSQATGGAA